jgi:hypothetical protein
MGVLAVCSCYSHEAGGLDGVIRKCIVNYAMNIFVLFPFSGRKIGCSKQTNLLKSFMSICLKWFVISYYLSRLSRTTRG